MSEGLSEARYVEEILSGEMRSRALILGHQLGLFRCLGDGQSRTPEELASALRIADVERLKKLLRVLEGLRLLVGSDGRYANTDIANRALLRTSPAYIGGMIDFFADQFRHKTTPRMFGTVKHGLKVREKPTPVEWENYLSGMACVARMSSARIAEAMALDGAHSLLDLGGGPGSYSIAFATRYPELDITLYELEHTLARADLLIRAAGMQDRIRCVEGSVTDEDLGGPYDAVFLSHVIHLFDEEAVERMLAASLRSTRSGGRVVVRDFIMNPAKAEPLLGALIGFNLWLAGDAYSFVEVRDLMERVGLLDVELIEIAEDGPALMGDLVVGRAP